MTMKLAQLSHEAARAVLDACAATISANGSKPIDARGEAALEALARHVLHTDAAIDRGARVPDDLGELIVDEALRDHVTAVLTTCTVMDGVIDSERLAVVQQASALLGRTPEVVVGLADIAKDNVLRQRFCLLRRVTRDMYHSSLWEAFARVVDSMVHRDDELVARYRALEALPDGTYGREIFNFYRDNMFRFPGERGPMPAYLTCAHDARHVLAGWDGGADGEVGLAAFESGASRRPQLDNLIGALLHLHVGIEMYESYVPTRTQPVDMSQLLGEIGRGSNAAEEIMNPQWDFWAHTAQPIAEARRALGVAEGGSVRPGGTVRWCGREGLHQHQLPLDKMTLLPETNNELVALRVDGQLSKADIEAVRDLFERRAWNERRFDVLLELGEGGGYSDASAFWADLELAVKNRNAFRRMAVVGSSNWQQLLVTLDRPFASLFGISERFFRDRAAALAFLQS